jgi:hypothetical protein
VRKLLKLKKVEIVEKTPRTRKYALIVELILNSTAVEEIEKSLVTPKTVGINRKTLELKQP